MIDARQQFDTSPLTQERVISEAIKQCGTVKELCERSGLTRDYLHKLRKGNQSWSFQVQFLMESIAKGM